jgi:hypothetical protein
MSSPLSDRMEEILDRFDEAWDGPTPPRIEDYLADADREQRLALLIELVHIDLERRLAAGEWARLEVTYPRQRFPELYANLAAVVTLVKREFELRRRNEPNLIAAEYLERFPQCQTQLLAELTVLDKGHGEKKPQQRFPNWDELSLLVEGGDAKPALPEITEVVSAPMELDPRRYELIEAVGKGGMGEVYRCCDPALGRDLAIKVMDAALRGRALIEQRFLREARITGSLQHPGIVPVHNLGRLADGRLHYTMRLVRGRTLADILVDEPASRSACRIS